MKLFIKSLILPLKEINAALPSTGIIYDLGCGEGVVSEYLARYSSHRQIIGIDQDRKKISLAQSRHSFSNLKFIAEDLTQIDFRRTSGCLLSDVLHHLSPSVQKQLLTKLSRQLPPGSIVVIKEINKHAMIRSRLSRLWDWLLYPKDSIHYWPAYQLINTMEKLNFKVTFQPTTRWFPGSTNLFVCTKR